MSSNDFKPKFSCKFYCTFCDYGTSKKSNIVSHNNSLKHIKSMNVKLISNDFQPKISLNHSCKNCYKEYKDYSGLWRHKKKCKVEIPIENETNNEDMYDIKTLTNLVLDIVKQNKDLSQQNFDLTSKIVDICKNNSNIDLISEFKELHPDWKKCSSRVSDQFNKIVIESMGGAGDNEYENEEKVIKKVAKEVFVDKSL